MIDVAYAKRMARYNRWQNESLYGAADTLTDEERRRERGAFFGSLYATFTHLLWADAVWLTRFYGATPPPDSRAGTTQVYPDWPTIKLLRTDLDAEIVRWADALAPDWLDGDLAYFSGTFGREISGPRWTFVAHFFNHQTHHRGQCHCLLTQCGLKLQDTDLTVMPE